MAETATPADTQTADATQTVGAPDEVATPLQPSPDAPPNQHCAAPVAQQPDVAGVEADDSSDSPFDDTDDRATDAGWPGDPHDGFSDESHDGFPDGFPDDSPDESSPTTLPSSPDSVPDAKTTPRLVPDASPATPIATAPSESILGPQKPALSGVRRVQQSWDAVNARHATRRHTLPEVILWEGDEAASVASLLQVLGPHPTVFNHGGKLKEVVPDTATPDSHSRLKLSTIESGRLRSILSTLCVAYEHSDKKDPVTGRNVKVVKLPDSILHGCLQDPILQGVRPLRTVLRSPTITAEGVPLVQSQYHPKVCTYMARDTQVEWVKEPLSLESARAAYDTLVSELFSEFRFSSECAEFGPDVAASALLSTLAIPGINCKAPAFVASASGQSAGKSTLLAMLAQVVSGTAFPAISLPPKSRDPRDAGNHMRVQIESFVQQGESFLHVSNWHSGYPFGDANIARSMSDMSLSVRPYGQNDEMRHLEDRLMWFIDGNNFTLTRETELERRILLLQLIPQPDRSFRLGDTDEVVSYLHANRPQLLGLCYHILQSYIATGIPKDTTALRELRSTRGATSNAMPSFGMWDRYIRCCLLWLGVSDPIQANIFARNTYVTKAEGNLIAFLREWWSLHGSTPVTLRELVSPKPTATRDADATASAVRHLLEAIQGFSETAVEVERGTPVRLNAQRLDAALERYNERPSGLGPFRLSRTGTKRKNATVWQLTATDEREAALAPDEEVGEVKEKERGY